MRKTLLMMLVVVSIQSLKAGDRVTTATPQPNCQEVIDAAKQALDACEDASKKKDELIEEDEATFALMMKQRNDAIQSAGVGQSMPFYFWVVLGIAGGVVLTRGIR